MVKPIRRGQRQFAGGLLLGTLGMLVWVLWRHLSTSGEPGPSSAPMERSDAQSDRSSSDVPLKSLYPPVRWRHRTAAAGILIVAVVAPVLLIRDVGLRWPFFVFLAGALVLLGAVVVFPHVLAPWRDPDDLVRVKGLTDKERVQLADDRRKLQNDVRTAVLQAVVGGTVLAGVLFTWQQQQATSQQIADQAVITRQGQVGERFSRAVSQLGDESTDVRLGGLYELEQLSRPETNAPERRQVVIEVVAAYIREHAPPPATSKGQKARYPTQDVGAALTILSRRVIEVGDPEADLRRTNFSRMILIRADLDQVDLRIADLRSANLTDATLRSAILRGANFRGANLNRANLSNADLRGADLNAKSLNRTNFRGADLRSTKLRNADLRSTDLNGARASRSTEWPPGFDWRRAGVQEVK